MVSVFVCSGQHLNNRFSCADQGCKVNAKFPYFLLKAHADPKQFLSGGGGSKVLTFLFCFCFSHYNLQRGEGVVPLLYAGHHRCWPAIPVAFHWRDDDGELLGVCIRGPSPHLYSFALR